MAEKKGIEVVAIKGFSALVNGQIVTAAKGKKLMMPADADWIKAGLAKPVGNEKAIETASVSPAENAVKVGKKK